ncbi:MAG: hypothetical protein E7314_01210 [Clostridiales bacterium]|nr:hypothetical protein [Clostridiales bacterium]
MQNIAKKISNTLFLSSLFLLIALVTILIFSSVLFIFNMDIVGFFSIISILLSFFIYYFVTIKKGQFSKLEIVLGNILAVILIILAIILSTQIYDFAWDSNWYHKSALGCLKLGWNPVYQAFEEFIPKTDMAVGCLKSAKIWVDHYCKASWIVGANIYSLTNNIETAKAINLIMIFILFGISYHYFVSTRFKFWQALILSFLLVFNPITVSQVFTLYVDNLLMTNLFAIIVMLFAITDNKYGLDRWYKYFILAMLVIFCINIKFTGLAYAGVFCFLFFCIWCVKAFFDGELKTVFVKNMIFYIVTCSIAVFIVGASSYLTNFIEKGHPLYPLAGEEKIDIMSTNEPYIFKGMPTLNKLFIALFGETTNKLEYEFEKPKKLFSVSDEEIFYCGYDTRIGGFGPLFSGILIISIIVVVSSLILLYKKDKYWFAIFASMLVTIFLMLSLITESWWARYSPYLYLIPIFAVAFLFIGFNYFGISQKKIFGIVSVFMVGALTINTSYFAKYIVDCKNRTDIAKAELINYSKTSQDNKLQINYIHGTLAGMEFNLKDYGINYELVYRTDNSGKYTYGGMIKIEN